MSNQSDTAEAIRLAEIEEKFIKDKVR